MAAEQQWTVTSWGVVDGGILGAIILCVVCHGIETYDCKMCDGDGELHQPYLYPSGKPIDLYGPDAELHFAAALNEPAMPLEDTDGR